MVGACANTAQTSYVDPASGGASGIHFAKVLDRLGIANEMKSKTPFPNPQPPSAAVMASAKDREAAKATRRTA
jgi:hypothetical protein